MSKEIHFLEDGYYVDKLEKDIEKLKEKRNQLQTMVKTYEEVIEEVREYVKRNSIHFATREKVGNYFANCNCDELLQILDKVKEN